MASAHSTSVWANEVPQRRWLIERGSDPRVEDRSTVHISFDDRRSSSEDLVWRSFPEVSFGERAKAVIGPLQVGPFRSLHRKPLRDGQYDLQVAWSGMELARPGATPHYFSVILGFYYTDVADQPMVGLAVRDLVKPGVRVLADAINLADWCRSAPIPLLDEADLARELLGAVFGTRIVPARQRQASLHLVLPSENGDRRLIWRFSAGGDATADGFWMPAGPPEDLLHAHPVGAGQSVDVWRDHAALDAIPAATVAPPPKPAGPAATDRASAVGAATGQDAGSTTTAPRTVAELSAPKPGRVVVLGSTPVAADQAASLVLDAFEFTMDKPVRVVRQDASSDPAGFVIGEGQPRLPVAIATTLPLLCGTLTVVTTRAGQPPRREGPFRLGVGTLTFFGTAVHGPLRLDAAFDLKAGQRSLFTAFGPLEIERPEDKRVRRRDALALPDSADERPRAPQFEFREPARFAVVDGVLRGFEITARVCSAGVALNDADPHGQFDPLGDGRQACRADLGFPRGCEVLFRLSGLNDSAATRPGIGRISLGRPRGVIPEAAGFGAPYSLPLDSAVLRLHRWRDLTSLTYRFAGLDLVQEGGRSFLSPRGLAREVAPDATSGGAHLDMGGARHDPRAMMVVEFPSQHVAEEAFFEQRNARPTLPPYPSDVPDDDGTLRAAFDSLASLYRSQRDGADEAELDRLAKTRLDKRNALRGAAKKAASSPQIDEYNAFADDFERAGVALTAEQRIYVGSAFLDPQARLTAEIVTNDRAQKAKLDNAAFYDALPDDPVSQVDMDAAGKHAADLLPTGNTGAVDKLKDTLIDRERMTRDPFFVRLSQDYPAAVAKLGTRPQGAEALAVFTGRADFRDAVEKIRKAIKDGAPDADALAKFLKPLPDFVTALVASVQQEMGLGGAETPTPLSRARLSGPSRLAFRINTDDFETGATGGSIDFSLAELTNWSRHELAVVRRAEKLLRAYDDGSRRPLWDLDEDHDLAAQLLRQGFSRGGWTPRASDDTRPPRDWPEAMVTADQRLAEVAASASAPPGPFETAIELPFRLILSPAQDGRFRTRRDVPDWLFGRRYGPFKPTAQVVDPLWVAAFETQANSALRAVWSPDFRPEAFVPDTAPPGDTVSRPSPARSNRPPPRGPFPPWALGRQWQDNGESTALGTIGRFRTGLDAADRHELVSLTALHGLPVIGKVAAGPSGNTTIRVGKDQIEPPEGFQVATPGWPKKPTGDIRDQLPGLNDIYLPRPLEPVGLELGLSSLGGFLRVNASFDPPASIMTGKGDDYFNALSIERWRHEIVLGRDISAEVVYKGYLFPFGVHCSLIKITERRFQSVSNRAGPVAVLRQRMFLRVGKPDKMFPAYQQPDDGHRLPFTSLRILTTQSPDIVDPYDQTGSIDSTTGITGNGRIDLSADSNARGTAFWPRTAKRPGGEVLFDLLIDGVIPTRLPLIFVDNAAANNASAIALLCQHYNRLGRVDSASATSLVTAGFGGAKLTYAPESKAGDTQFATYGLVLGAEGRVPVGTVRTAGYQPFPPTGDAAPANNYFASDPFMQGADQPPFYPAMRFSTVKVEQIERLVGQPLAPTRVAYDPTYALQGFGGAIPNKKEIYLSLIDTTAVGFGAGGDKGGAVARPGMTVHALSRIVGPISANPVSAPAVAAAPAAAPAPDPDDPPDITARLNGITKFGPALFGLDATLLGMIKLSDLVDALLELEGVDIPTLHELLDFGGGLAGDADSVIRDRVLLPLQAALAALHDPLLGGVAIGGTSVKVATVYPDVVATYGKLSDSVETALSAPPAGSAGDLVAEIGTYTAVYTDGRAFVNALDKAVRDPLTPLREAAKNWLNMTVSTARAELEDALKTVQPILDLLKPDILRRALQTYVATEVMTRLRTAVIILPQPIGAGAQTAAVSARLFDVLDQSVVDALGHPAVWPDDTFFDPAGFKTALLAAFAAKAANQVDAALAAAQADALARLDATDLFVPDAVAILKTLGDTTAKLADLPPDAWLHDTTLFKLADPIRQALLRFRGLAKIGAAFHNGCALGFQALDSLIRAALPVDHLPPLAACVAKAPPDCRLGDPADVAGAFPSGVAFSRLSIGLSVLNGVTITFDTTVRAETRAIFAQLRAVFGAGAPLANAAEAITKDLVDLHGLIEAYTRESFTAAGVCAGPGSSTAWQLPRLVSYARHFSLLGARCIDQASTLLDGLREVLKPDGVLFAAAPAAAVVHTGTDTTDPLVDPTTWTWNGLPAVIGSDDATYWLDLLRLRYLYLCLPTLRSAGDVMQAMSLAGVVPAGIPERVQAFRDLAGTGGALRTLLQTTLPDAGDQALLAAIPARLDAVFSADAAAYVSTLSARAAAAQAGIDQAVDAIIAAVQGSSIAAATPDALARAIDALHGIAGEIVGTVVGAIGTGFGTDPFGQVDGATIVQPLQLLVAQLLDRVVGQAQDAVAALVGPLASTSGKKLAALLRKLFDAGLGARNHFAADIASLAADVTPLAAQLQGALLAPAGVPALTTATDALALQDAKLAAIESALNAASTTDAQVGALVDLFGMIGSWSRTSYADPATPFIGPNAIALIVRQSGDVVAGLTRDVLRGDLSKVVDFTAIKADAERRLRELIPTKITLAYDFDTKLQDIGGIFLPDDGSRLTLKARTVIDLLNGQPPQVSSSGEVGPFSVRILGDLFDIVTLSFDGAKFGSETGGKLKANITDVQIGEAVSFLQAVSSFFSFGDNGFYLAALFSPPGIEAGYRMPPCGFALGVLGITNLSLNASAVLPFDNSPALFKVGLSRPEAPFLINVGVYGGGGHLALYANATGIIGFEASFEFGAVVTFNIGPLTGQGRVTSGVFLRTFQDGKNSVSTVEGYATVAGSASIAIFRFAAMLQVRVGQQPNGSMVGTAIFTFSFSMGIKDIEFRVTAHKELGRGFSSNSAVGDAGDAARQAGRRIQVASNLPFQQLAADLPFPSGSGGGDASCPSQAATLVNHAVCKGDNYQRYQSYFDPHQPWQPEFF